MARTYIPSSGKVSIQYRGLVWCLVVLFLVFAFGCVIPSQETVKHVKHTELPSLKTTENAVSSEKPQEGKLVKPFIPEDTDAAVVPPHRDISGNAPPNPAKDAPMRESAPVSMGNAQGPKGAAPLTGEAEPSSRLWEEDKNVKTKALELAKANSAVKKMKICYSVPDDEWWVILYEDITVAYDLKQFVWNRDQGRFDPHLVVKTIPRDQLEQHVKSHEKGMECEVLTPPL